MTQKVQINDLIYLQQETGTDLWKVGVSTAPGRRAKVAHGMKLHAAVEYIISVSAGACTSLEEVLVLLRDAPGRITARIEQEVPKYYAKISAVYLPLLVPFIAKNDTRGHLAGIAIQRHPVRGIYLVASDGNALACVHDERGILDGPSELIIPLSRALVAASKKRYPLPTITKGKRDYLLPQHAVFCNDRVHLVSQHCQDAKPSVFVIDQNHLHMERAEPIQQKFPDWKWMLQEHRFGKTDAVAINTEYMDAIARALKPTLGKHPTASMQFSTEDQGGLIIKVPDLPNFVAKIMPRKIEGDAFGLPQWLTVDLDESQEAA